MRFCQTYVRVGLDIPFNVDSGYGKFINLVCI